MHIKQVVLQGFRSFRTQSEIEPFSPKHNVIIGRNGSGKSNFFAAIQFVLLSQKFMHLRQDERQALLHEGAGANVMSAFVEVIFDNSDGRMAVEGDEVVLRRTIGVKKDEFFLNRKRVTKQEVSSLLESAGFSRSNPYYIVQQGKVNILTLMKDEQRLDLLKEVAGTKVYEERREESKQIMQETNNKREKIEEVVAYIDERLGELEEEKDELKAYQQLDKDRRALEYTLYDKELKQARDELTRTDEQRLEASERSDDYHRQLHELKAKVSQMDGELGRLVEDLQKKEAARAGIEKEREGLITERERLDLEIKGLESRISDDASSQEELQKELAKVEQEIANVRKDLTGRVEPEFKEAQSKADELKNRMRECERIKSELYEKQGRRSAFRTVEERDKHLKKQCAEIQDSIKQLEGLVEKSMADKQKSIKQIEHERASVEKRKREVQSKETELADIGKELSRLMLLRSDKQEERKTGQQTSVQLSEERNRLREKLNKSEQSLRYSMARNIFQGIRSVEDIVRKENIPGYYGPVYELITLNEPKFTTAVEVAASHSLTNVVVDSDETAATLMKRLNERKGGRVTFMPLNRLRVKNIRYPESPDVVPLMRAAMTYPPEVEKAMQQIFGRKLLARNWEAAARASESSDMDAITLEGDEVNRKGSMQGGFHDEKNQKLSHVAVIREASEQLGPLESKTETAEKKALELDREITKMLSDIHKYETVKTNLTHEIDICMTQDRQSEKKIEALTSNISKIEETLPGHQSELQDLRQQLDTYKAEMGTPLETNLSAAEQQKLQAIEGEIPQLNKLIQKATDALNKKKSERSRLKARVDENLEKRKAQILQDLAPESGGAGRMKSMGINENKRLLEQKKGEMKQLVKKVMAVEEKLRAQDENKDRQQAEERQLKSQVEDCRGEEVKVKEKIAEVAKAQEKLLNKRSMALQKRESNLKKIQELGSLPLAELEMYKNLAIKQLYKKLHECNESLKKYSHVNKKALDQYVNFSEQRTELLQRKKELDEGHEAIQKLIENLDRQKDEAIIRTFRGVSMHFKDVFKELVPNGYGRMVMRTTADKTKELGEEEEGADAGGDQGRKSTEKEPAMRVSEFVGIQIQVSFTGTGDRYLMQQLSGGQKALVALALIFSIQRCDPAPFYLFDEVDQALDSTYRAAVAALIERQANSDTNPAQFITSTFRPELVRVADRCYGITHQNKVSNIHILEKNTALDFVADLQHEEEATGKPQTSGARRKSSVQQPPPGEDGDRDQEDMDEDDDEDGSGQEEKSSAKARGKKRKAGH